MKTMLKILGTKSLWFCVIAAVIAFGASCGNGSTGGNPGTSSTPPVTPPGTPPVTPTPGTPGTPGTPSGPTGPVPGEIMTDSPGFRFVWIPAGTFTMGSPVGETGRVADEKEHEVVLTSGFNIGNHPITQGQWKMVMGDVDERLTKISADTRGEGDQFPMYYVNWCDAVVFCNKLSVMEGLEPAYSINGETDPAEWDDPGAYSVNWHHNVEFIKDSNGYRLPTEAQWEYACRAGGSTAFNDGVVSWNTASAEALGWYSSNAAGKTHEVMGKTPNDWELYDMHGNVMEWCWDFYDDYDYSFQTHTTAGAGANEDPAGALIPGSPERIMRGGEYSGIAQHARSARRPARSFSDRNNYTGFRIVIPELP